MININKSSERETDTNWNGQVKNVKKGKKNGDKGKLIVERRKRKEKVGSDPPETDWMAG